MHFVYKVLDDFSSRVESSLWTEGNAACAAYSGLESALQKYQNPREADALTKVQEELDETKIILVIILDVILYHPQLMQLFFYLA